jgi:lipoprotein-releasing system permease protein
MGKIAERSFELFVAARYLRARRKEAVISVITLISVAGVAAGVMALVIALAVTNGFRNTLERNLLGAMAHIDIEEKGSDGIIGWRELCDRLRHMPHVKAVSPSLYLPVLMAGGIRPKEAVLKGVDVDAELGISDALRRLKEGSVDPLRDAHAQPPGVIIGNQLRDDTGLLLKSVATVITTPESGELTPMGPESSIRKFRIAGVFETDFYEIDDLWAYTSIQAVQRALGADDVVNQIELKVDDLNRAPEIAAAIGKAIGSHYTATAWQEKNHALLNSMKMERIVTAIVISLIILVAALNILIVLVMMVMEKYKDIAILMSMGARREQIRRIFILQGVLIGVVGSAIGLTLGYSFAHLADKYKLFPLEKSVYAFSFVPFDARWTDGFWIAGLAILVSFLATLYPARNATRIAPVEVLRYE